MAGATETSFDDPVRRVPAGTVRAQLARVLASEGFLSSPRLCRFLRFLVERTLDEDGERLKEYVVAIEVFDRSEDYDPNIDSIVRVEARRLRSKLKNYYEGPGRSDPVRIILRPGSYIPAFHPVGSVESLPPAAGEPTVSAITTIAVLPFLNLSPEPEQDYFCDGITEEIINVLAGIQNLGVVARTSAFQFKGKPVDIREVGERLGAQVVVEGSVRKAGNQLRVTAQAIDATKGYHLWSETYRRELDDIFTIQEELSSAIANTLKKKLPARSTNPPLKPNIEAYTGFLKAMYLVHQQNIGGLHEAVNEFRRLLRMHPAYAPPYAGLAAALGVLTLFGAMRGPSALPEIRQCAREAVRLDGESAEAWTVLAGVTAHYDRDWELSDQYFRRAISLQPGSAGPRAWYGMVLVACGRLADAERELARVAQLNPLAASDHTRMGYLRYLLGEDTKAMEHFEIARRLDPEFPEGRLYPALLFIRRHHYRQAIETLSVNLEPSPLPVQLGLLGAAYALGGERESSHRCLARLEAFAREGYVTPLASAWTWLGLGDFDRAFEHLALAIDESTVFAQFLKVDPFYDPLRADPRFAELLKSLNLYP